MGTRKIENYINDKGITIIMVSQLSLITPEVEEKMINWRSCGLSLRDILKKLRDEEGIDVGLHTVHITIKNSKKNQIIKSIRENGELAEVAKEEIFGIVDDVNKISQELWLLYGLSREDGDNELALKILEKLIAWLGPAKAIIYPLVEGVNANTEQNLDIFKLTQRVVNAVDALGPEEKERLIIDIKRDEPIGVSETNDPTMDVEEILEQTSKKDDSNLLV